jgi:hypothetical protein
MDISNDSVLVNVIRAASAVCGFLAAYYAAAFMIRYRRVDWKSSAWGRHIYGFARMIVVVAIASGLLRLARLIGWDLDAPIVTAMFGLVVFAWLAWQMRERYNLEGETNAEKAARQDGYDDKHPDSPPRAR